MSRIYTRDLQGKIMKFDWPEKVGHTRAVGILKTNKIKFKGPVFVVHTKE